MPRPTALLARARRQASAVPLRVRLVAILLALAVVALTVTGSIAVTLLRGQLLDKVDTQVSAVADSVVRTGRLGALGGSPDRGQLPTSQYGVLLLDSGRQLQLVQRLDTDVPLPDLRGLGVARVVALDGSPVTVGAVEGSGRWRCVGVRVPTDVGDGTLVVAQSLADVDDTVARMAAALAGVGLAVLMALGLLGWLAVRRAFRPLTQVEVVAQAIADGDLSRRVPTNPASTEVGRLAASLNAMLSQIEQAFAVREASEERMRRFVSDASHELRTPLAAVRGYAELYRQGAVTEPADVAGAMRRIEDEATRMGLLVEDLLTLARMDEQRPQRHGPVDLTVLAADAVQDARALERGRDVTLRGSSGPLGPVVVEGDEPRLRQVVTNLVANALRHTPAGSPVEVLVGVERATGTLAVVDHGSGIAPEHARSVFERFFRADSSRQRSRGGGSGLGLAIVAAIVAGHRGQVGVTETTGGGATFIVRLPLQPVAAALTADSQADSST